MKGLEAMRGPLERYVYGRTPIDLPEPDAQRFARAVAARLEATIALELDWLARGVHPTFTPRARRRAAR